MAKTIPGNPSSRQDTGPSVRPPIGKGTKTASVKTGKRSG